MDEMHEVSLRVHHLVVQTVMMVAKTVRAGAGCTQVILAEAIQVQALVRRVQGAGDLPADDCVVVVFLLGDVVSTVHLSSNDHPEMGSLISQLLDFKTSRFNIAWSPLGIQRLHATLAEMVPTMKSEI